MVDVKIVHFCGYLARMGTTVSSVDVEKGISFRHTHLIHHVKHIIK